MGGMPRLDLSLCSRNVWALIAFWAVAFVVFSLLLPVGASTVPMEMIGS